MILDSKFERKAEKSKVLEMLCSYDISTTGYIFFFFKECLCKYTVAIIRRKSVSKTGADQCLGKKFRSKEIQRPKRKVKSFFSQTISYTVL